MDLIQSFQELPPHKYAVLGVCLVIVLGFLVKSGVALFIRAVLVVGFLLVALFLFFAVKG